MALRRPTAGQAIATEARGFSANSATFDDLVGRCAPVPPQVDG